MLLGWLTRGIQSSSTLVAVIGGQWAWNADASSVRVFPIRVRDDVMVEMGHTESDDPAQDTRDLP